MVKEEKKKSWKETQRERQIRQQKSEEAYQKQKEAETKIKPRKLSKGKMILGICLIASILSVSVYGVWQYNEGQKPPVIGSNIAAPSPAPNSPNPKISAQEFSLQDINGTLVSLSQFKGEVIGIHFMAVGCHGQINPINEYQLTQLKGACNNFCGKEPATILTVAVATCQSSDLNVLRNDYGVTWTLGNDYADGTLDIVDAYVPHEIGDGTVVLIDKNFNIAQVYNGGVAAETLSSKMRQLLEA